MSVKELIENLRSELVGTGIHPTNEANTRSWIIRPLLEHCGYNRYEISEEEHNGNSQFPDYTILPNTPHTWYLEAKSWTHSLQINDANQALNYANTQGKRWVVLSNGREWHLYDGHLVAVPTAQRLMTEARLDKPGELEAFLNALHKASVQSNQVTNFAIAGRLTALLEHELPKSDSELIKAITDILRGRTGLANVTASQIADWFKKDTPHVTPAPSRSASSPKTDKPFPNSKTTPLSELLNTPDKGTGQNPCGLHLSDGTFEPAHNWREVAIALVRWLYANGKPPVLPFSGQIKGKRFFLNNSPNHADRPMNEYKVIAVGSQTVYLHTNRSARDFLLCLGALCRHVGVSPDAIKLKFD